MAAHRPEKRQLKREREAVRPYSRSQLANDQRQQSELHRQMTLAHLQWLQPHLPPDWRRWSQHDTRHGLCCSAVLGMDMPLLQRFMQVIPAPDKLYVHSLSDTEALVFDNASHAFAARLQQAQIADWQTSAAQTTEFETRLRAVDATALHAAWQQFSEEMDKPVNLGQFGIQVFDAGLDEQRLVCISPITLDWMEHYCNIDTNCRWFNGVSRIMDGAEIAHTMSHGRD
ncbi:MAG: hypothetical protein LBJ15_09800 [Comamonas sp.]|jgi:hypothetical protein|uniref:hypothetical protein n=1 Tax=Comamonas sp. TaxID=34028 RepID=UPI002833988E|nr:hypothetical protein [Comamonas sp.]MDR0214282.1 hypothetical protein [Comamonas sp.]